MKKKYILFSAFFSLFAFGTYAQQLPYTEIFVPVAPNSGILPIGWNSTTSIVILSDNANAYAAPNGSGSVMFNLFNSGGLTSLNAITPTLTNASTNTVKLSFDFAAAVYHSGPQSLPQTYAQDRFRIYASTDNGTTYSLAKDYLIGDTGELNTGGIKYNQIFGNPTATEWVNKTLTLPAGTNKVKFEIFRPTLTLPGNMAYLDNVILEECLTPMPQGANRQYNVNYTTIADLVVTGQNLSWYSDAALTTPIPVTTPLVKGTTYYVTDKANDCESIALAILFDTEGSVNDNVFANLKIYPNPTSDKLFITGIDTVDAVNLYDLSGKLVLSAKQTEISVAHLKTGLYMVEIKFQNAKKVEKIIVK